ncbi:purine nucleosidase [Frondihabitans sp. PhB188]|uniref:nucleoside hydrolase n=1 Tax=Frondihabitans sp. PhB188 TaxID=2485200 RepID=UPI000F47F4E8|nr:nucleoside hydrolase [Frondihabitans sp. PhB188]ROQ38550.1 purine nucleosidase [Frondihabitans sp. PhB188]
MTRTVHVDTDTGIDDALALLFLAAQPDVEIVGISAVYGNCVVDDALRNIGHVTRLGGRPLTPVSRGAAGPLAAEAHIAHYVHGHDGLGDVVETRLLPEVLLELTAAEHLVKSANDAPGEVDLLTLGPLTNLALALAQDPLLLTKFRSVTIMGGSGPFPELGASHMFDANIQNDPKAAKAVFSAPATRRVMVGVNATGTVFTDEADIKALHASGTPTGTFAADILESYLDFYQFAWGRRVSPVHDGLAAALTVRPEWIAESASGPVNITDDGFTVRARIMTAADGTPVPWAIDEVPDTIAVLTVDIDAFHRAFLDALVGGGARTQGAPE